MTLHVPHVRVALRAFPGVVIEDSWVQIKSSYQFLREAPTALVVGSALEFDDGPRKLADRKTLGKYCEDIGRMLARHHFNVINGACPGLPDMAMEAFNASSRRTLSVGLSAYDSPRTHMDPKKFAPHGFPLSADITVFCGTGFELLNVLNTLCADLLIVVGGGVGALLEAATAVEQELTVLCLGPSGGVSVDLHSLLAKYIARFKSFDVRLCKDVEMIEQQIACFRGQFAKSCRVTRLTPLIQDIARAKSDRETTVQYEISRDTSWIRYSYRDVSIKLFKPVLMTDRVRISRIPSKGERILAALEWRPRAYLFQEVKVVTSPSVNSVIWAPNIDTLLMLKVLAARQKQFVDKTFLEIGCSCGMIAMWLASLCSNNNVLGLDTDPASVLCAEWNCLSQNLSDRCKFRVGKFEDGVEGKFDIIVSNPPYLPAVDGMSATSTAFSDCRLLNYICKNYRDYLAEEGQCLITASSASFLDAQFRDNFDQLSSGGSLRVVHTACIPLKVYEVLDDEEWVRRLEESGGIFRRTDDDYTWWHEVNLIELVH